MKTPDLEKELLPDIHRIKQRWPFRVGTTSFIEPGPILPNVRMLAPVVDEIELLIFESRPFQAKDGPKTVLPTRDEIRELAVISRDTGVTYNVHLPVDVSMTHPDKIHRHEAVETIARVMDLCAPIQPTTHTLHLPLKGFDDRTETFRENGDLSRRQDRSIHSLEALKKQVGTLSAISLETLSYPPEYLFPILDATDAALCMDVGHIMAHGYPAAPVFERYRHRVPLMHLHGVDFSFDPPKDHQGLSRTPDHVLAPVLDILDQFDGVVSLEVFRRADLQDSLACLGGI